MKKFSTAILVCLLFSPFLLSAGNSTTEQQAQKNHLYFIENRGQVTTLQGKELSDVKYVVKDHGLTIFIYPNGLTYQFTQTGNDKSIFINDDDDIAQIRSNENTAIKTHRVDMTLTGATSNAEIIAEGRADYFENYYNIPSHPEGITNVSAYNKITVKNIYPGINWIIYINNNSLKYDFEVTPGADASLIKMQIKDADVLELLSDKEMRVATSMGAISDSKLFCYEKGTGAEINSEFSLKRNIVSFSIAQYDRSKTLIIDPELTWSTYCGGEDEDAGNGIAVDHAQNILITGYTSSEVGMAQSGFQNSYTGGNYDLYVAKFNAFGERLWSTYYGGTSADFGTDICINSSNQIYATGYSQSSNFITTPGAYQSVNAGLYDSYILKLNEDGTRVWATLFGGNFDDFNRGISLDSDGDVFVVGTTYSTTGVSFNGYQNTFGGVYDQYLAKFTSEGSREWCTYFGGEGEDYARGMVIDADNNIYTTGYTESVNQIALNAFDATLAGSHDCTLAKYDPTGTLLWATYYGGSGDDNGNGVAVDAAGDVYMAVQTGSKNGLSFNGHQASGGGSADALLVKFTAAGSRAWATYYGNNLEDMGKSVTVFGNSVYMVGHSYSTTGIAVSGFQNTNAGASDAYIIKFDLNGVFAWCSYTGGAGVEYGRAVEAYDDNTVYFTGKSFSANFPTTVGAHQETFGGFEADAFLQRITDCNSPQTYYADEDGDGFGDDMVSVLTCTPDPGYVLTGNDCDDANSGAYPGATELCNTFDDDCDGSIDEDIINTTYYADADGDGYGDVNHTQLSCMGIPSGYVISNSDCNDANAFIHPGATEICNTIDDDCDAVNDEDVISTTITPLGPITFCSGTTVTLQAAAGAGFTYQWKKNGITIPGATSQNYVASASASFSVVISAGGGTCTATATAVVVTVNKKPKPEIVPLSDLDICALGKVKLKTASKVGDVFEWYKNGVIIAGATTNIYTATTIGSYVVKETSAAGCFKSSPTAVVTSSCKNGEVVIDENDLSVFPNPAKNILYVALTIASDKTENDLMVLYNELGQIIYRSEAAIVSGKLNTQINLPSGSSNGIYLLQINTSGGVYSERIVVSN